MILYRMPHNTQLFDNQSYLAILVSLFPIYRNWREGAGPLLDRHPTLLFFQPQLLFSLGHASIFSALYSNRDLPKKIGKEKTNRQTETAEPSISARVSNQIQNSGSVAGGGGALLEKESEAFL